jgi:hypothetical protein
MNMKYARQQYMDHEVTHRQYYAQFVTPEIKTIVLDRFGLQRLLRSHDEHLNDIPLGEWDSLAGRISADDNSLCARVCTLKEAARQLIEESRKEHAV